MVFDPLTVFFDLLFLGVGVAALLVSIDPLPDFSSASAEYYTLVIWCTLGSMLIAPAADLFTLFLCLQLTSLPLVVLIGYSKNDPRSGEAALKYLMVALVATALFLFGISFVYGALGTSSFAGIEAALASGAIQPVVMVGLRAHARRRRLQDDVRPVPVLGPRCLRGGTFAGNGVRLRRLEADGVRAWCCASP